METREQNYRHGKRTLEEKKEGCRKTLERKTRKTRSGRAQQGEKKIG